MAGQVSVQAGKHIAQGRGPGSPRGEGSPEEVGGRPARGLGAACLRRLEQGTVLA